MPAPRPAAAARAGAAAAGADALELHALELRARAPSRAPTRSSSAAARADALERRVQALDRISSLAALVLVVGMNAEALARASPAHAAALLSGGGVFAAVAWLLPRRAYLRVRNAIAFVMPLVAASAPHLRDPAFTPPRLRGGAGGVLLDVWRVLGGARVTHAFCLQVFASVPLSLGVARAAAIAALARSPAACASPLMAARAPAVAALHAAFAHLAGGGAPLAPATPVARCESAVLFAQAAAGCLLAPALLVRLKHPVIELAALRGGRLARTDALLEALLGASPIGPAHAAFSAYAALVWLYLLSLYIAGW